MEHAIAYSILADSRFAQRYFSNDNLDYDRDTLTDDQLTDINALLCEVNQQGV